MKTDNRTVGGQFEQEMADMLGKHGFWCHVMQQNKSGQPADLIAVKGSYHTLIDCKVISDRRGFPFERIEDNQRLAMRLFQKRCQELCYFALRLPDGSVWMMSLERLEIIRSSGNTRASEEEIRKRAWPLEKWLDMANTWSKEI